MSFGRKTKKYASWFLGTKKQLIEKNYFKTYWNIPPRMDALLSKTLSFLAPMFLSSQSGIIQLQFMWLLKHLWICLFAWVTNICFPVLFIHIWEPFMMELIHWRILNMFHSKELQSDPSCKEVGKVQFLLLGYCSLFLKLHLRGVICSDEILQRYFWLSKPDLETEVSQKERKTNILH